MTEKNMPNRIFAGSYEVEGNPNSLTFWGEKSEEIAPINCTEYVRADVVESIKRKMIADSFLTVCECVKELGGELSANMKGVLRAFEQMEADARKAVKHSKDEMK